MLTKQRFIIASLMAWFLFLMIDFLAHATLLSSFWAQEYPVFKSSPELFQLIPLGYLSFLILAVLMGWLYVRIYGEEGNSIKGLSFGAAFGGFYSLVIFFGWYSSLNLPILFIFLIGIVYYVEILAVGFTYGFLLHPKSIKKRLWILTIIIIFGFISAIILQNIWFQR